MGAGTTLSAAKNRRDMHASASVFNTRAYNGTKGHPRTKGLQ